MLPYNDTTPSIGLSSMTMGFNPAAPIACRIEYHTPETKMTLKAAPNHGNLEARLLVYPDSWESHIQKPSVVSFAVPELWPKTAKSIQKPSREPNELHHASTTQHTCPVACCQLLGAFTTLLLPVVCTCCCLICLKARKTRVMVSPCAVHWFDSAPGCTSTF